MAEQLDKNERYILAYLHSDDGAAAHWGWLTARLFTAILFTIGFVNENWALIFTGFATLLALDLYMTSKQPRWTRLIRSAVAKLESRIEELEAAERTP